METATDDGGRNGFWTFNVGHLAGIAAVIISVLGSFVVFTTRFEGHEYRLQSLERAETSAASVPGRVTVLETRLDIVQSQLTQLNMTSNRTSDIVQGIREDMAGLKAAVARGN